MPTDTKIISQKIQAEMTPIAVKATHEEATGHEREDLRVIFSSIKGAGEQLELRNILQVPGIETQIAEGDIAVDELESAWLEACMPEGIKGGDASCNAVTPATPKNGDDEQEGVRQGGTSTGLSFDAFVHFLSLCESRVSMSKAFGVSGVSTESGGNLVAARRHMIGLVRATLKVHLSGEAGAPEDQIGGKAQDDDASLGERLHLAMVRAALEESLAHHTPESLRELMRKGIFKSSPEDARLEREAREKMLSCLLSKQAPYDEVKRSGILLDKTPEELSSERQSAASSVKHGLENRPTVGELIQQGLITGLSSRGKQVERAFLASKLKHDLQHRTDMDQLQQKGIVLDMAPEQAHEAQRRAAEQVQLCLNSRPTLEDVRASNILQSSEETNARLDEAKETLEEMLNKRSANGRGDAGCDSDKDVLASRRLTLEGLKAQGIYLTPAQVEEIAKRHELTKSLLEHGLSGRAQLSELVARGIYRSPQSLAKQSLERSLRLDQLKKSLGTRPDREDLMDRGVLEASGLKDAFQELQSKEPVDHAAKLLKWPLLAYALERNMVTMPCLEKAFADAMGTDAAHEETAESTNAEGMSYVQFEAFLSAVPITQDGKEPLSLKRWALMRMHAAVDEEQHHESNRRRNALMATDLERGLSRREPLEQLANKGIYLERTPVETGVERAHLKHTLADGLRHRPTLDELVHKGVFLEGIDSGDLERSHRDARNTLEGMLSLPPDLHVLEEKGYLEADDLEGTFLELVSNSKRDHQEGGSDVVRDIAGETESRLPEERLVSWEPVRAMVESGAAIQDDVDAALAKAKEAMTNAGEGDEMGSGIDFLGFLEFVHNLDLEVDGLGADGGGEGVDAEARERRKKRLERRKARVAQAVSEEANKNHRTLKDHLLAHLKSRPSRDDPETQRIAKEFHRAEAVELEKELVKNRLESHLRSRIDNKEASLEAGNGHRARVGVVSSERAAKVRELEFKLNKRMLMHKLARRTPGEELLHKGILHPQSARQERLERLLVSNAIKHGLESRPSLAEVEGAVMYKDFRADHEAAAQRIAQSLESRPSPQDMTTRGILAPAPSSWEDRTDRAAQEASAPQTGSTGGVAPMEAGEQSETSVSLKREAIEEGLDGRPTLEELRSRGVYQDTTPGKHKADRDQVERQLENCLGNARRPTMKQLQEQGIYMKATPQEFQMAHQLAARNLKHGLEGRETIQDLKDHGIYLPGDAKQALHNKLLVKALLRRRLAQSFSAEELAQLKQKGIYREEEHEKLKAERALVTQQLARLMSTRPNLSDLEQQHPGLLEASTLALVFEERVRPRFTENGACGHAEHLVSLEALMTWPDVQEFVERGGGEKAKQEIAQYFRVCDSDGDGFLTFSQFLRWVELCDLNPEDHMEVSDVDLDAEFVRLVGMKDGSIPLDRAATSRLVQRWATSGRLGPKELEALWANGDKEGNAEAFEAFCRRCEARSSAAHERRVEAIRVETSQQESAAKERLKARLSAKLSARPDLEELKRARIYKSGGLDPATELLERDLIVNDLKQQLLSRPAIEELERRGIRPRDDYKAQLEKNTVMLAEALDATVQHDDARWRSDPSQLVVGSREEVSAALQTNLVKRAPLEELSNKGIYIIDSDASYALLVHKVLQAHVGFKKSSAEIAASLHQDNLATKTKQS